MEQATEKCLDQAQESLDSISALRATPGQLELLSVPGSGSEPRALGALGRVSAPEPGQLLIHLFQPAVGFLPWP